MAQLRAIQLIVALVGLVTLVAACGGSSGSPASPTPESRLVVDNVERVFVTRAFGGPLPVTLLYLEFQPEVPSSLILESTGSDGQAYRGARPVDAKICGFPDYLGHGPNAGSEGNRRTVAFIVRDGVTLVDLRWRPGPDAEERVMPLPAETVVCTPEDAGF